MIPYKRRLPTSFTKNGLPYKLVLRNKLVALYTVGGIYDPNVYHYEVIRIYKIKEKTIEDRTIEAHEAIPGNEQFGLDGSKVFNSRQRAEEYFLEFTELLESKNDLQIDLDKRKTLQSNTCGPLEIDNNLSREI